MFADTGKKLKTASGIYVNPIDILIIRKNQFRVLRSLILGKNLDFLLEHQIKLVTVKILYQYNVNCLILYVETDLLVVGK